MVEKRQDRSRSGTIPPDTRSDATRRTEPVPPRSRRAFLWKAWIGLAFIGVAEVLWVIVDFLRPGPARNEGVCVVGLVQSLSV